MANPPPGYGRPGGYYPTVGGERIGPPPPPAAGTPTYTNPTTGEQEPVDVAPGLNPRESQFVRGVYESLDKSYRGQARDAFVQSGADINNWAVQAMLDQFEHMSDDFEENPGMFQQMLGQSIMNLQTQGIITQTPYSGALIESGFGFNEPSFNTPPSLSSIYNIPMGASPDYRAHVLAQFEGEGVDFVTNQETGWTQWKNGVLVNPNYEIGNINAVIFEPNSTAPGSQRWLTETVPSWSQGKISEWRGKLVEGGYLSEDMKKGPIDATFLNAMRQYQAVKYQNGGTPMAIGPQLGGSTGTTPFNFKQLQGQVANDIRVQWRSIYGQDPDQQDIEPLQDMVIKTAHRLYLKGQMSSSQAAQEAEERMITRMEQSPEAQFVTSNLDENTSLHDQILRAVQVTSAMG